MDRLKKIIKTLKNGSLLQEETKLITYNLPGEGQELENTK